MNEAFTIQQPFGLIALQRQGLKVFPKSFHKSPIKIRQTARE
jgi:hypothetical protein